MESEFSIVAHDDADAVVVLQGVLDAWNAGPAQEAIRRAAHRGQNGVCLDVGGLSTIDGCGIQALAAAARAIQRDGGRVELRHASSPLLTRLARYGVVHLFGLNSILIGPTFVPDRRVRIVWKEDRFRRPAALECLPEVRHRIVRFCSALGLAGEALDSMHLAAGEAVTNAVRHGCREDSRLEVEVRCAATEVQVVTEIQDPGPGFDPGSVGTPCVEALRPGGMGIHLMRSVLDEVQYEFGQEGTVARLIKRFPRPRPLAGQRLAGHGAFDIEPRCDA